MTGSHINQIASVVGRVGRVRYDNITVLNQRVGKIINKNDETSSLDYIYYYLSQYEVKVELAQKAGGAANQANISPSDIKNLLFPCPPFEVQCRIATILSRYDSLIENYQKQIKLLEEAAQRLPDTAKCWTGMCYFVKNVMKFLRELCHILTEIWQLIINMVTEWGYVCTPVLVARY